jgi:hypothetical protein
MKDFPVKCDWSAGLLQKQQAAATSMPAPAASRR